MKIRTASFFLALCLLAACSADSTTQGASSTSGGETSVAGEVAPSHGARLFGVYVVVASPGAPELEAAAAPLRDRGIMLSVGELACDTGAAEALAAAPDAHAVSVMFATREAADAFAQSLQSPPAGIAEITVGCAD
jgi:hypothetical protein